MKVESKNVVRLLEVKATGVAHSNCNSPSASVGFNWKS